MDYELMIGPAIALDRIFAKTEVTKWVPRFDPSTGKKVAPRKETRIRYTLKKGAFPSRKKRIFMSGCENDCTALQYFAGITDITPYEVVKQFYKEFRVVNGLLIAVARTTEYASGGDELSVSIDSLDVDGSYAAADARLFKLTGIQDAPVTAALSVSC